MKRDKKIKKFFEQEVLNNYIPQKEEIKTTRSIGQKKNIFLLATTAVVSMAAIVAIVFCVVYLNRPTPGNDRTFSAGGNTYGVSISNAEINAHLTTFDLIADEISFETMTTQALYDSNDSFVAYKQQADGLSTMGFDFMIYIEFSNIQLEERYKYENIHGLQFDRSGSFCDIPMLYTDVVDLISEDGEEDLFFTVADGKIITGKETIYYHVEYFTLEQEGDIEEILTEIIVHK